MNKKKIAKNDNVVNFPSKLTSIEKEIEAIIFAAAEPLDVDTIESKLSKKVNIEKSLEKAKRNFLVKSVSNGTITFAAATARSPSGSLKIDISAIGEFSFRKRSC